MLIPKNQHNFCRSRFSLSCGHDQNSADNSAEAALLFWVSASHDPKQEADNFAEFCRVSIPNTLLLILRGVLGVHLLRYFYSVSDRFHGQSGTSGVSDRDVAARKQQVMVNKIDVAWCECRSSAMISEICLCEPHGTTNVTPCRQRLSRPWISAAGIALRPLRTLQGRRHHPSTARGAPKVYLLEELSS
jgi:hypothetical protein